MKTRLLIIMGMVLIPFVIPQILECQENGDTWIREKLDCVREKENEK